MSLLQEGDLSLWNSMVFVELKSTLVKTHKTWIRPELVCNRVLRKGTCSRANCRFSPCVLKDLKAMEWYKVAKCWK